MDMRLVQLTKAQLVKILWDLKLPATNNEKINPLRQRLRNYLIARGLHISELVKKTDGVIKVREICDHEPVAMEMPGLNTLKFSSFKDWICSKCKSPLKAEWIKI